MSHLFRASLCALALSLGLKGLVFPRVQFSSEVPDSFQSPAETAVRPLVEKCFALYAAKDLDGLMNLWGRQSPDYTSFKQDLERQFMTEDVRFSPPTISRVNVEVEKVSLRATVNLTAVNLKSNQKREQRMARNMAFIVEDGKWKIWRCAPAENDLAEALAQAKTEEERAGLLAEDKELVTGELV